MLEGDGWEKNELANDKVSLLAGGGGSIQSVLMRWGWKFDFGAFLGKHNKQAVEATINPVIEHLKKQGVTTFAATGYCFGVSPPAAPSVLQIV